MERILLYLGGIGLLVALAYAPQWWPADWLSTGSSEGDDAASADGDDADLPLPPPARPVPAPPYTGSFHRGMVVGMYPHGDERPRYRDDFAEIHALGANAVSLNYNWYMDTIRDDRVYDGVAHPNHQTPSDDILARAIADAHAEGLHVMLFPSIYVLTLQQGEWRGKIDPPSWPAWFRSYRRLMVDHARLAERYDAEYLCIGVELLSAAVHNEEWRRLIRDVRRVYSGRLLYSANWDVQDQQPWYRELDMMAMNGYHDLTTSTSPTKEALVTRWRQIRRQLATWRETIGLPLIVSEIGYRSTDGTAMAPWNYFKKGEIDLAEQELCYDAFFEAWHDDSMFQGVYIYQWFGDGGPDDGSYTPRGKPAAETLQRWFHRIEERDPSGHYDPSQVPDNADTPEPFGHPIPSSADGTPGADDRSPMVAGSPGVAEVEVREIRTEPARIWVAGVNDRWLRADETFRLPSGRYTITEINPALHTVTIRDETTGYVWTVLAPTGERSSRDRTPLPPLGPRPN